MFADVIIRKILNMTNVLGTALILSACQMPDSKSVTLSVNSKEKEAATKKPNVLLVVVDDAGFGDFGAFGSEIETPNIDNLAKNAAVLTNFHVAPTCSPTRSMLLSGVDSHIAGLGNMFEELAPNQQGKPGYEGYLHTRVAALPELFQEAGYRTYMTGKWHLGLKADQSPQQRGFDRSFALLQGGAGHFSDMQALFEDTVGDIGRAKYREDGQMLEKLPDSFAYSSQFYVDRLISYLGGDSASDKAKSEAEKPFFAYLSFSAPHWPLQAPDTVIDKYKGRYKDGYEVLAARRLQGQKEAGLVPDSTRLSARPSNAPEWGAMSEDDQRRSARTMEVYAAMVDELDSHLGRLLEYLEKRDELDNTIIVFMSDNGPEGHSLDELFPEQHFPKERKWVLETFDYSEANIGKAGSYVFYGSGWGWSGAPAFRGYKGYTSQGGTRVPAFIYYPDKIKSQLNHALLSVKDIAPTLLDMSGISKTNEVFRGRAVEPISGISLLPLLRSGSEHANVLQAQASESRVLGYELFGKRSIRQDSWSLVHMFVPYGNDKWQLYDLSKDLGEASDLSQSHPQKLAEMLALWEQYAEENNVVLPDWNSGY